MIEAPPDIHDNEPEKKIPLPKVGIVKYATPINLDLLECCERICEVEAYIDLPDNMRGAHISRLARTIEYASKNKSCHNPRKLIEEMTKKLLETHPKSSSSLVRIKTTLMYKGKRIEISVGGVRKKETFTEEVQISLNGLTACPCAKDVYRFYEKTPLESTPTHMQRAKLNVKIYGGKLLEDKKKLEEIIRILNSSFSSELEKIVDRKKEYMIIKKAINNPMFAEDVVRKAAFELKQKLPKGTALHVSIESFESIHDYNVYAEWGDII